MPSPSYVPVIATGRPLTVTDLTATSSVVVASAGTAINAVDRAATSNFGAYVLRTAGVDRWALQMKNDATNKLYLTDSANGVDVLSFTPGAVPALATTGTLTSTGALASSVVQAALVNTDTVDRFRLRADGRMDFGPGGASARDTALYRSGTAALATDGAFVLAQAGAGLQIKEGANATSGAATLVAGTVTVNTTKVSATSRIQLTVQSLGTVTAPKAVGVTARVAATSFTITSADPTDTSVIAWTIIEPAP